jgi:microcystin-dependent protein
MEPFLGEIRLMGCSYAPKGWALCNGQLLPINANQALFSLLGTTYGGNGVQNFGLPDLRGRVALGFGQGPDLANYALGQTGGTESVGLTVAQMPAHLHPLSGTIKVADSPSQSSPATGYPADSGSTTQYSTSASNTTLNGASLGGISDAMGSNQPHENRQPVLALNYCIATSGLYPSRG